MLIEFSVKNFKSIKDTQVISLLATAEKGLQRNKISLDNYKEMSILNSAVIFGANGSGKSNFILAFNAFRKLISSSDKNGPEQRIREYTPFKLDAVSALKSTEFEIEFMNKKGIRYFYSVEFDSHEIISEKLLYYPRVRKVTVFERMKGKEIEFGKFPGPKKTIEVLLGKNQLFLSKAAKSENDFLAEVYKILLYGFGTISSSGGNYSSGKRTIEYIRESDDNKQIVKALLQAADVNIQDVIVKKSNYDDKMISSIIENFADDIKEKVLKGMKYEPMFIHNSFDENDKEIGSVEFTLQEESEGTRKLFELSSKIVKALEAGETLLIDEINNGLHPVLGLFILDLFQNTEVNRNRAQLIIVTHDVSFMEENLFRNDQIWFVEKDKQGRSSAYSLSEFGEDKKLHGKNVSLRNWYLSGRFGGIPVIRDLLLRRAQNG